MAQHESTTYAAQAAAAAQAGSLIADSVLISGKSRLLQLSWTAPANATADTVLMGYLPAGCTVIPGLSTVVMSAAGGAGVHTLGTADDPDAISAAVSLNTAGPSLLGGVVPSFKNDTRQAIILTIGGTAVTTGRVVTINLFLATGE